MIWVESGSFLMGGDGRMEARPITRVTLSKGFWLAKRRLTKSQYQAVALVSHMDWEKPGLMSRRTMCRGTTR